MKYLLNAFLLPLLLLCSCISENEPEIVSHQPGDKCPQFSVVMNDGSEIDTSDLRGHRTMIVFFNTSCADCREELPIVQQVADSLTEEGKEADIICIARDQEATSIEEFWRENGLTLSFSPQSDRRIYNLFASSVIPRIYIIDEHLTIIKCWDDNPLPSFAELIESFR